MYLDKMGNVLQPHPNMLLHVPKPKKFKHACPPTKFFWGTHPKIEIGASIKTTLFYVPTSCQIVKGILIFLLPPLTFNQIWLCPLVHDCQPT
jgi:hypothetical protein